MAEVDEPKRPRAPEFQPRLEPWGGERRRPSDPGTNRKQPARRYYRQFEPYGPCDDAPLSPLEHEQRLTRQIFGK